VVTLPIVEFLFARLVEDEATAERYVRFAEMPPCRVSAIMR
jgi:hypothetical protein